MGTAVQSTFPNYAPRDRQFTDAEYPVKVFSSMNGVEFRRIYGSQPTNYKLQLQYTLPDAQALEFRAHYRNQRGTYASFTLDASLLVWRGLSNAAATDLTTNPQGIAIRWRYESPPQITPIPGAGQYSTVTVNLVGVVQTNFNQ